jgi:hypothetical protein
MRRTKEAFTLVLLTALLFALGCASIVSKSSYPIIINSQPDQATITIKNEDGLSIYRGSTPTTVTLKPSTGYFQGQSYTVTFSKDGYEEQTAFINYELDPWYIGNILFGGLIGLLIVDPLTGAMWTLEPDVLQIGLAEKTASLDSNEPTLHIVLIDDIPNHLRSKMVRVK